MLQVVYMTSCLYDVYSLSTVPSVKIFAESQSFIFKRQISSAGKGGVRSAESVSVKVFL